MTLRYVKKIKRPPWWSPWHALRRRSLARDLVTLVASSCVTAMLIHFSKGVGEEHGVAHASLHDRHVPALETSGGVAHLGGQHAHALASPNTLLAHVVASSFVLSFRGLAGAVATLLGRHHTPAQVMPAATSTDHLAEARGGVHKGGASMGGGEADVDTHEGMGGGVTEAGTKMPAEPSSTQMRQARRKHRRRHGHRAHYDAVLEDKIVGGKELSLMLANGSMLNDTLMAADDRVNGQLALGDDGLNGTVLGQSNVTTLATPSPDPGGQEGQKGDGHTGGDAESEVASSMTPMEGEEGEQGGQGGQWDDDDSTEALEVESPKASSGGAVDGFDEPVRRSDEFAAEGGRLQDVADERDEVTDSDNGDDGGDNGDGGGDDDSDAGGDGGDDDGGDVGGGDGGGDNHGGDDVNGGGGEGNNDGSGGDRNFGQGEEREREVREEEEEEDGEGEEEGQDGARGGGADGQSEAGSGLPGSLPASEGAAGPVDGSSKAIVLPADGAEALANAGTNATLSTAATAQQSKGKVKGAYRDCAANKTAQPPNLDGVSLALPAKIALEDIFISQKNHARLRTGKFAVPPSAVHLLPRDGAQVLRRYSFKSCAIVGNSGALRFMTLGNTIDSHDLVVRTNQAPTHSYRRHVGQKTTMRVVNKSWTSNYGSGRWRELGLPLEAGVSLIITRSPGKALAQMHHSLGKIRPDVRILQLSSRIVTACRNAYVQYRIALCKAGYGPFIGGATPTSGLVMTYVLMQLCKHVTLYGFGQAGAHRIGGVMGHVVYIPYHYYAGVGARAEGDLTHSFEAEEAFLRQLDREHFIKMCRLPTGDITPESMYMREFCGINPLLKPSGPANFSSPKP